MGKLIFSAIASLDGYVADESGDFSWAAPDPEVHAFANELERPIGLHLYGRRMYEVMAAWETFGLGSDDPPEIREFGRVWRAAEKVVFSRTLTQATTERTRIESEFRPEEVRAIKSAAASDISIGGPTLAAAALHAGLVDELYLLLCPIVIGGGLPALPAHLRVPLTLLEERSFRSGVTYLRYRV